MTIVWCDSPPAIISFWQAFVHLTKMKLKSGQINLPKHLAHHVNFEVINRLKNALLALYYYSYIHTYFNHAIVTWGLNLYPQDKP